MELEVHIMPGLHDCFVALPLYVIHALQSGHDSIPSFVVLELRLLDSNNSWYLAWAGAGSTSSFIEISERLAGCIGLPNGSQVIVRALTDVAKAKTIVLEPASEDDWEILELNADYVEDHILSQVGVLCMGQLFPVWVQGNNALVLRVVSTMPKPVVQLVPGAELVVAPKQRKRMESLSDLTSDKMHSVSEETCSSSAKAWLRVQELDPSLVQMCEMEKFPYQIVPTTIVFVAPPIAKGIPFSNGQLVILTSASTTWLRRKRYNDIPNTGGQNSMLKARVADGEKGESRNRFMVVRLVHCSLVVKGHAMIASSLRRFIGARIHSRMHKCLIAFQGFNF
eukprot:c22398_g1_i1 orf=364-1377(+)